MITPEYPCPVCRQPLFYKLTVEPMFTKSLRCKTCNVRVTIPIDIWKRNHGNGGNL